MLGPGEGGYFVLEEGYLVLGRVDTWSWGGWILGPGGGWILSPGEGGCFVLGRVDI